MSSFASRLVITGVVIIALLLAVNFLACWYFRPVTCPLGISYCNCCIAPSAEPVPLEQIQLRSPYHRIQRTIRYRIFQDLLRNTNTV